MKKSNADQDSTVNPEPGHADTQVLGLGGWEKLQHWRRRAEAILAEVERGGVRALDALESASVQGLEATVDEAIEWGMTIRDAVADERYKDIAGLMRHCYEQRVTPEGWQISKVERFEDGEQVDLWRAEYLRARVDGWIEIDPRGDGSSGSNAPPFGALIRALRQAIGVSRSANGQDSEPQQQIVERWRRYVGLINQAIAENDAATLRRAFEVVEAEDVCDGALEAGLSLREYVAKVERDVADIGSKEQTTAA